ncbi:MAG: energy transducer TonB [Gemmatimonadota bacterium]|nr:energy transducer TonB [Gemmatimonadota bacterium]
MLNVLLESAARTPRPNRATVFSVVIHTALIVVFLADQQGSRAEPERGETENVRYLIPLNRVKAPPPLEVPTHWHGLGLVGEGTGLDAALRVSDALTGPPVSGRKSMANEATAAAAQDVMYDTIATAIDVDSIARVVHSAAPGYPETLLARNVEGKAVVQFVVDTLGLVDTLSFAVIEATHAEFADAVRAVLPAMRFTPAIMSSRKVRQLVQQPFLFRIVPPTQAVAKADSAS